jgi:hypothetical protein
MPLRAMFALRPAILKFEHSSQCEGPAPARRSANPALLDPKPLTGGFADRRRRVPKTMSGKGEKIN